MAKTLQELADFVGGNVKGDGNVTIERVAGIEEAGVGDITFVSNPKYVSKLQTTRASGAIVSPQVKDAPCSLIVCENPYLAFARIVELVMWQPQNHPKGRSDGAHVSPSATIGTGTVIYPNVFIGDGVRIGDGVVIHPNAVVEEGCEIGDETELFPGVVLYPRTRVGCRCVLHANVVLGASGFGFAPDGDRWYPIRQAGICVIEDDVSIGANTTICRGAMERTIIRRGTKIDSNVVISHNCDIGEDCLIISLVGISGTVNIGRHCTLAGQVGVTGHLSIGDNAIIAGQAGVTHDLPGNQVYLGSPAIPAAKARRAYVMIPRIPEMLQKIRKLETELEQLKEKKES